MVFTGFPTTKIFASRLAVVFKAFPCVAKISPFFFRRSLLSIPGPLGTDPIRNAASMPSKASCNDVVTCTRCNKGKAPSSSSMRTPDKALSVPGIS
ncbi:Uncharacterised protein [Chlamydia trachomatis]|nr:Uncharacterised protein [Chlamydia trachomatis]